jgi:hypothetical protein
MGNILQGPEKIGMRNKKSDAQPRITCKIAIKCQE